jgi:hypothetical protein
MEHTLGIEWFCSKVVLYKTLMSTSMIPLDALSRTILSLRNPTREGSLDLHCERPSKGVEDALLCNMLFNDFGRS